MICLLHSLMEEGKLTELSNGMSEGEKCLVITIVVKLNSLPKLLLLYNLLNHGTKLKEEPIWILSRGNVRIMLLKAYLGSASYLRCGPDDWVNLY